METIEEQNLSVYNFSLSGVSYEMYIYFLLQTLKSNEKRNDYTANASEQMSTCVYHMFIGTGTYKCSILNSWSCWSQEGGTK